MKCVCLVGWRKCFFVLSVCPAEVVRLGTAALKQAASHGSSVGAGKHDLNNLNRSIHMEATEGMAEEGVQDWCGLMAPNQKGH